MSKNEAAERLPRQFCSVCRKTTDDYLTDYKDWEGSPRRFHTCRSCALAAERRATVKRIRERFNDLANLGFTAGGLKMGMKDILDEEAAR